MLRNRPHCWSRGRRGEHAGHPAGTAAGGSHGLRRRLRGGARGSASCEGAGLGGPRRAVVPGPTEALGGTSGEIHEAAPTSRPRNDPARVRAEDRPGRRRPVGQGFWTHGMAPGRGAAPPRRGSGLRRRHRNGRRRVRRRRPFPRPGRLGNGARTPARRRPGRAAPTPPGDLRDGAQAVDPARIRRSVPIPRPNRSRGRARSGAASVRSSPAVSVAQGRWTPGSAGAGHVDRGGRRGCRDRRGRHGDAGLCRP